MAWDRSRKTSLTEKEAHVIYSTIIQNPLFLSSILLSAMASSGTTPHLGAARQQITTQCGWQIAHTRQITSYMPTKRPQRY